MLRSPWQNKIYYLNQRYLASATHILQKNVNFCCEIEIFEKIKLFFACNIHHIAGVKIYDKQRIFLYQNC